MSDGASKAGMTALKALSVLLALGLLSYAVVAAQNNATNKPSKPSTQTDGSPAADPTSASPEDETFLSTSKSMAPFSLPASDEEDSKVKIDPEVFLPSSKSGVRIRPKQQQQEAGGS